MARCGTEAFVKEVVGTLEQDCLRNIAPATAEFRRTLMGEKSGLDTDREQVHALSDRRGIESVVCDDFASL